MVSRFWPPCATSISRWALALLCVAFCVGCKKEQVRVYFAPKEIATTQEPGGQPHVHYKTPAGWTDLGAGGMRAARFSVPSKSGNEIDVSIIALPGISAGKADIVNLWREQVRLPQVTDQELVNMTETVEIGGKQGELFDMVSGEPLINETHKARILVAMVKDGDTSWFMKMTGEEESVRARKPEFVEFLKSLAFDYTAHEAPAQFSANRGGDKTARGPKPGWQVPAHWKEVEPTEMLLAKFVVTGKANEKAEVTVSVFPGDVGGPHANINRWRRQLGLPELDEQGTKKLAQPLDAGKPDAMLIDMSGDTTRLIGAIVPEGSRTWFYKLMGSPGVAEAEKAVLVRFIQSAKHTNGG
jgi:hypothetical protein